MNVCVHTRDAVAVTHMYKPRSYVRTELGPVPMTASCFLLDPVLQVPVCWKWYLESRKRDACVNTSVEILLPPGILQKTEFF